MVKGVEGIHVVAYDIEQSAVLISRDLLLQPDGACHEAHDILQLVVAVKLDLLVDGVALDEVLLEDRGSLTTKLHTLLALHSISHGDNNIKIIERNRLV